MLGDKSKWGKGYGFEAWRGTCNYLFAIGIRKIEAGCMALNKPMINICYRYGMTLEGRREEYFLVDGKASDMMMFGKIQP